MFGISEAVCSVYIEIYGANGLSYFHGLWNGFNGHYLPVKIVPMGKDSRNCRREVNCPSIPFPSGIGK